MAARPATLAASVSPVLVGVSIATRDGMVRPLPAAGALLVAVALQVGVNYANDYSDFVHGADTPSRVGPLRAAASGIVAASHVRNAAIAALGFAAVVGLAVSVIVDWRLIPLGALCIIGAWMYTGGPHPYGYVGLGELAVFVFFGLVATAGTVYVNEGRLTALSIGGGVATGSFASAVLVLNNLRDIDTDAAAGKRTLAVKTGRPATRALLVALLVAPFVVSATAAGFGGLGPVGLLPWLAAPLAVMPVVASQRREGPALVAALKRTAVVEVVYALLWALALVI
jgi:1,4-dihydroxy-2-naphthoate polyprenyltransferase